LTNWRGKGRAGVGRNKRSEFLDSNSSTGDQACKRAPTAYSRATRSPYGLCPSRTFCHLELLPVRRRTRDCHIDRFDYRLEMARVACAAEAINDEKVDSVIKTLRDMTAGRGPA